MLHLSILIQVLRLTLKCCLSFPQRESALLELSKRRESFPDLAPILWHSFGTIAALLQEVVSVYPMLSPPTLSSAASNRVCNALALLQCVASHPETKLKLIQGTKSNWIVAPYGVYLYLYFLSLFLGLFKYSAHPIISVSFLKHGVQGPAF
jgi:hypothetical protein